MKDTEQIIKMLRQHRMGCFGCGYEHNCRDNGCALMQMAANELEKLTHHKDYGKTWLAYQRGVNKHDPQNP